ncbi:MAG: ImmA/IrrE family metallo-endopeptidase [Enterococcaceae bacterium]|jgi:Zn-dependent peptidase ImmA (M78 family)|nr:ImmA/IrrE family metallo-endopeptidase [Enterococcaceae bacterium]
MDLPYIDKTIKKLVKTYQTRDPYRLAKELNVLVLIENLGDIYGYYNNLRRIKMIHINSNMSDNKKRITCAHELGHSILHPAENTPMLSQVTIASELKIEKEANYFAINLIVDPSADGIEYLQKYQKLEYFGLSDEFVRYI